MATLADNLSYYKYIIYDQNKAFFVIYGTAALLGYGMWKLATRKQKRLYGNWYI
jgi:hypothetical protein